MASAVARTLRLACAQLRVGADKVANAHVAVAAIEEAAAGGAGMVVLPECWNAPYDMTRFPAYAEPIPMQRSALTAHANPSTLALSEAAKKHSVFVVGGSIPEVDDAGRVYNTCVVFNPEGEIVAKHRKMHLFDIDIPGGITFKESSCLTAGDSVTLFDTPYGRCGVGICYDMRFPLHAQLMRDAGAVLLLYPAAFNTTTGPAHWTLLQRARAVDNQCYVATASPARLEDSSYKAWGHSSITNPWGEVVATCEETPTIVTADLDLDRVTQVRAQIPIIKQARKDIYELKQVGGVFPSPM